MLLLVVVDQGMIVALAARHVPAQEQPADVASDDVRIGLAVQQESRRGASRGVTPVGRQDLPHQHVVGPVLGKRLVEELAPWGRWHVEVGPPLHQHHVEDLLHPAGVDRTLEQAVHECLALVWRGIVQERASLGGGGDHPGQIEPDPPQELTIGGRCCGLLPRYLIRQPSLDQPVNLLVQRDGEAHPPRYGLGGGRRGRRSRGL